MTSFYANVWLPPKLPEVLGRKLVPLTLGHAYLLFVSESKIVHGGDVGFEDVISCVWMCSQEWKRAAERIVADNWLKEVIAWGKETKDYDLAAETKKLMGYLSVYLAAPPRWEEAKTSVSRVPWMISVAWLLMSRMHEDEAWNMPLPRAMAYAAAEAERNGDKSLMSWEEIKKVEMMSNG